MYGKIPRLYEREYGEKSVSRNPRTFLPFKICITTKGNGVWQINNRQVSVSAGDVFFMSNTDYRCFTHIKEPIRMIVCEIEPMFTEKIFLPLFKNRPTELPRSFSLKTMPEFEKHIKDALKETVEKKPYAEFYVTQSVNLALTCALRRFSRGIRKPFKEMRKEVVNTLEFVEKHIAEDISLEQIAKEQNISASALCKQFSKSVGIGFSRYVSQKRVEGVIKILSSDKNINVLDAAFSYGFKNSAAFYEAFKRITGSTPGEIRKNPYIL